MRSITVRETLSWWGLALKFWRRAPIRIAIACLLPPIAEGLIQLVPLVGTPLSKVVEPLLINGLFVVFEKLRTSGHFEWGGLFWSFEAGNRGRALQLAFISVGVFVLQLIVATAVYGYSALDIAVLGHIAEHREMVGRDFSLVLILPGMLPAVLIMFAGPLVVLGGERPIQAVKSSVQVLLSSPLAFGVTCAILVSVMAAVLWWPFAILLLLLLLPLMTLLGYVAYRDVFIDDGE